MIKSNETNQIVLEENIAYFEINEIRDFNTQ